MTRYVLSTLAQQTPGRRFPRMRPMDQPADPKKDNSKMLDSNIKEFIAAARQHLLGLLPPEAPHTISVARTLH